MEWEDEMKEKMEKTEYLGKIITANGKTYKEINNRVQKTKYISCQKNEKLGKRKSTIAQK
jgi:hypothetical protein